MNRQTPARQKRAAATFLPGLLQNPQTQFRLPDSALAKPSRQVVQADVPDMQYPIAGAIAMAPQEPRRDTPKITLFAWNIVAKETG
jgi:hypothetical protein